MTQLQTTMTNKSIIFIFCVLINGVVTGWMYLTHARLSIRVAPRLCSGKNLAEERRQQSRDVGHNPLLSLNLNLDALARAQAAERAQELYQRIAALHREGYYPVAPDVVSFNSVLKAWQSDPAKALDFWEEEVNQLSPRNKPNVRSYNTFLLSLANNGLCESAEKLLQQMQAANSAVKPDLISFNTVLLSYMLSSEPAAAERADALLKEMMSSNDIKPDTISFNTAIATWVVHAPPILAAQKAEEWLNKMKSSNHAKPDVYTYTTVLHASSLSGRERGKPFASYLPAERSLELLKEMNAAGLQANKVTYTVVMKALCESGKLKDAHALFDDMLRLSSERPELRPDCVSFTVLIDGYSKQESGSSGHNLSICEALFSQMKEAAREWPEACPSAQTYTSILSALARSRDWNAGEKAEKYLAEMWESLDSSMPTIIHYNALVNVYAKSPRPDKALHVIRIWSGMQEKGIVPDVITYNTFLSSIANSLVRGNRNLFTKGREVFYSLHDDPECIPTTLTYHYWFKILRNYMPSSPARDNLVKEAFDRCCQFGCLNDLVLTYLLENLVDPEEFFGKHYAILTRSSLTVRDLPREWSKNGLPIRNQLAVRR